MRENAEMALSSAIGEQVAKIAGAVWIHNLHSTGEEKMAIQTPVGTHHYYISEAVRCL